MTDKKKILKKQKLRNAEYYDMQPVFDQLYADSKKGLIFTHLVEIIKSPENIKLAYRNMRKNSGSKTAGTDKKTISDLNKWKEVNLISHIQRKLDYYIPQKVRRVEIPKDNGKTRPLGIPTIMDRLIQQCVMQVLEPICEAKFFERSNGFRPNRSAENAIAQAERMMQNMNLHYVVDVDIKSFFDNVSHGKLLKQMWSMGIRDKKLLCILSAMLKAEVAGIGFPEKGTPQGGILSPLLSNIVLNELDWWVASQWENFPTETNYIRRIYKNGTADKSKQVYYLRKTNLKECYIVRYADDFKIFCRKKSDAIKMLEATKLWLKDRLGLEINAEKSKIVNLKRHYSEFLGFKLKVRKKGKRKNGQPKFVAEVHIQDKRLAKIKKHSKEIISRIRQTYNKKLEFKLIQMYNSYLIGVHNYYSIATHVNLDFQKIAFDVKKSLYNRLKHRISKNGIIKNNYIKKQYGKSQEVRFMGENVIIPIAYVQHRVPMDKKRIVNKYTPQGREEIHKSLDCVDFEILHYLMNNPCGTQSVEYNDNRIAMYVAQKGKCAITKVKLAVNEIDCHHITPIYFGGGDEYKNLIIVSDKIHILIHSVNPKTLKKYLSAVNPDKKQLSKINALRVKAHMPEISENGELML